MAIRIRQPRRLFRTLEVLEDRLAPATFVVNSALDADDGLGINAVTTLRKAIRLANATPAADNITFATTLTNQTIAVQNAQLIISTPMTVVGLGASKLTVNGFNASGLFRIDDGSEASVAVSISGLRLTGGDSDQGGAIVNREALTLSGLVLDNNQAGEGGAIANIGAAARLTMSNSTLSSNFTHVSLPGFGGGIFNDRGSVTLTNTTLALNAATASGGGIFNDRGSVTLTNTSLADNAAAETGGGIYNALGDVTLTTSTLSRNQAALGGGGIHNDGTLSVANSRLTRNHAHTGSGGGIASYGTASLANARLDENFAGSSGGAIFAFLATTRLTDCALSANLSQNGSGGAIMMIRGILSVAHSRLSGNIADAGSGGGIHVFLGDLTLTDSILAHNRASSGGGLYNQNNATIANSTISDNHALRGGGIFNTGLSAISIKNSTVAANSATYGGGGILNDFGTLFVIGCAVLDNQAEVDSGGGIGLREGEVTIFNSTISGNAAKEKGAGVSNYAGTLTIANSTIVNNEGVSEGGGIWSQFGISAIYHTIVAGNRAADNFLNDIAGNNVAPTSNFNLIGTPSTAGGLSHDVNGNILGQDDGFGGRVPLPYDEILDPSPRNNGGRTATHALLPRSIAIDQGVSSGLLGMPYDQRGPGYSRFVNGRVDIGAFEMPAPLLLDNFNRSNNSDLGQPWINRTGALGIVGNHAQGTGTTTVHVSTLAGIATADVDLTAAITVGQNQRGGILARYAGSGDKNYYVASLARNSAGEASARIERNVNGVVTELAAVENIGTSTGTAVLRFRVVGATLQLFANGNLIATVRDSTFKSGALGLRTIGTTAVDDFEARTISTGVDNFDSFDRADNTLLTEPWARVVGNFRTIAGRTQGVDTLNLAVLTAAKQPDCDLQATATIAGLNHTAGLVARYQGNGDKNYYLARLKRTGAGFVAEVLKNINGAFTTLATTNLASSTGTADMRLLVTGNSLNFYVNQSAVASVFDSSLSNGCVGIRADAFAAIDDFRASTVRVDLPFSDRFSRPDNTPLGNEWTRRAGNFKIVSGKAVGASAVSAVNLSTLVGVKQSNVRIQAVVAPTIVNHEVGLLARYSGTGDKNYYMARVVKTASGFNLSLVKNINGVKTTLKSVNVTTIGGPVEFRMSANSLTLTVLGAGVQLTANDNNLTDGGIGIRTVGTGTIDDFDTEAL